jgi:hypothetical protein
MTQLLDLPVDLMHHIVSFVGMRGTRTLRALNTTHPAFSKGTGVELSVCENRCRDLFRESLSETQYVPTMSWINNLAECKNDICTELCWVAYKIKAGRGVLWKQGRIALKAAFLLDDFTWLRKNLPLVIDIYLGPSFGSKRMFDIWRSSPIGDITRRNYEGSLFLMIDNCLNSMQNRVRPHVCASLLSRILDYGFKRDGVDGIYKCGKEGRALYDKVLRYYRDVRPRYCLLRRYEKRIQIREN